MTMIISLKTLYEECENTKQKSNQDLFDWIVAHFFIIIGAVQKHGNVCSNPIESPACGRLVKIICLFFNTVLTRLEGLLLTITTRMRMRKEMKT